MKTLYFVFLTLFLILLQYSTIFACKCKSIDFAEQNNTDIIFIGKIVSVDLKGSVFTTQVIEQFKGSNNDTLFAIYDNCSIYPSKDDIWLIYANRVKEDTIYISQCGFSKNFNNPANLNLLNSPQPYLSGILNYSDSLILHGIQKNAVYDELYYQIEGLKLQRNYTILDELKADLKKMEISQKFMGIVISFLLLLNIIIMIKFIKILTQKK